MLKIFFYFFLIGSVLSSDITILDDFEYLNESKRIWDDNGDWYLAKIIPGSELPEEKTRVLAFNDTEPENITQYLCTNEIFEGNFEISLEIEALVQSSLSDPVNRLSVEAKNNLNGSFETLHFFENTRLAWKNLTVDLVKNISALEFSLCLAARYVDSPRKKGIYLSRFKATLLGTVTQPTEQPTSETPLVTEFNVTTSFFSTGMTPSIESTALKTTIGSSRTTYSSAETTDSTWRSTNSETTGTEITLPSTSSGTIALTSGITGYCVMMLAIAFLTFRNVMDFGIRKINGFHQYL
ncbi:hypothetical protein QYM36_002984 [Artemia franciscana]|uniref:Uncharacterized protein n=1 Tax=Artemia franciscana TaxID=6661 RepID=A0AA88LI66_ARTSF|nr:hypothetical protein QYM36_002984 [Artemia franciscana]